MWTDAELLDALCHGDDEAWQEAFHRLYPAALAAARHPMAALTASEAEDVAIEALTLLLPKVKEVDVFDELRPLVVTIASRKAISEKRRQLADKRGGGDVSSLDGLQDDETLRFEPAEQSAGNLSGPELVELAKILDKALGALDVEHANLLRDFFVQHLSYKELAAKYRMPMGSVGVSMARSLNKIRACLRTLPKFSEELSAFLR